MRATSGRMTPQLMVASLPSAPSPAMFPSTITAWFTILMSVEERSWTNIGTALASTTALVWWDEPEAMLASTHAASNCSLGLRREGGGSRRQDRRGSTRVRIMWDCSLCLLGLNNMASVCHCNHTGSTQSYGWGWAWERAWEQNSGEFVNQTLQHEQTYPYSLFWAFEQLYQSCNNVTPSENI